MKKTHRKKMHAKKPSFNVKRNANHRNRKCGGAAYSGYQEHSKISGPLSSFDESQFGLLCATNYERRVEFSLRLSWGPLSYSVNVPQGIPELENTTTAEKQERFENILYEFYEHIDLTKEGDECHPIDIKILPLECRDYSHSIITYSRGENASAA